MSASRPGSQIGAPLSVRKKPSQARSEQTVSAILEGAAHVLELQGLDGYTTNAVAIRAGVAIGSLYQYFPNKAALVSALIERESAALVGQVETALLVEDRIDAINAMIQVAVRHQLLRPRLARLLDLEESRLASEMPRSGAAAAIQAALAAFLGRSFPVEALDPQTAASDVMAVTKALTDGAGGRQETDAEALARRIAGTVLGYLGVPGPPL